MRRIFLAAVMLLGLATPAWAGFDEGFAAYKQGDYATALREWRLLAAQGNASAQSNLSIMYEKGQGVPLDDGAAVRWWYRKAAEQGDASAQNNLGSMYADGRGVPQDYVQAQMWWNLAAAGNEGARKNRDIVVKLMTPAQIAEAERLAREWKPKKEWALTASRMLNGSSRRRSGGVEVAG